MRTSLLLAVFALAACRYPNADQRWGLDADGDGYPPPIDCNDNNPNIHPGATDIPDDGIDQDCNGHDTVTCYVDNDQDGHGTADGTTVLDANGSCDTSQKEATSHDDCDDDNATIYPGATELCDGLQNDCNNWASASDPGTLPADELDSDGDGYVPCVFSPGITAQNWGHVQDPPIVGGGDCNDSDATTYPRTAVTPSNDPPAAGDTYEASDGCYTDADNDGYGALSGFATGATAGTDCNDDSATVHPGATETVGGLVDLNCDGMITCFADVDGDGYGDDANTQLISASEGSCDRPSLHAAAVGGDCNDTSAVTYPRTAVPPSNDPPAAGDTYEDSDGCYTDADNDGYGARSGFATGAKQGTDCDDGSSTVHPHATGTVGDAVDQNCDDMLTCYLDSDGDGHGTDAASSNTIQIAASNGTCDKPALHAATVGDDCDDAHPTVYPGAPEVCDGFVDDCDSWSGPTSPTPPADETDDDVGGGDGYVDCAFASVTTAAGETYTVTAGTYGIAGITGDKDCDDTNAAIYPGAPDLCDGYDNNCNHWTGTFPSQSPNLDSSEIDNDDDGYVECTFSDGVTAENWGNTEDPPVTGGGDCDDTDPYIYPGATELCDDKQNNCNDWVDGVPGTPIEDGTVSRDSDGTWTDLTDQFNTTSVSADQAGIYWLCTGVYRTTVNVTVDGVTLEGRNGRGSTYIDGQNSRQDVTVDTSGTTVVRGLTLRHGGGTSGGAMHIAGGGTTDIIDSALRISSATNGAGLYINSDDNTVDITGTVFYGDSAAHYGGAIYMANGTVSLASSTLSKDTGNGNSAGFSGGGIYMSNGTLTLGVDDSTYTPTDGVTISYNTAGNDGGGIDTENGTLTILDGSLLANNEAQGGSQHGGGAIASGGGSVDVEDSTISNNQASGNDGGGISIYADVAVNLTNSTIHDNTADSQGGGINCSAACTITATNSFIHDNHAVNGGGGGVILKDAGATFTCTSGTTDGAGLYLNDSTSSDTAEPLPAGGLMMTASPADTAVFATLRHCKMGTSGGSDDNTPYDFTTPKTELTNLDNDVSQDCTILGCSNPPQ